MNRGAVVQGVLKLPRSLPPTRFDTLWAERLIAAGLARVAAAYPPGAMEWIRAQRQDIAAYLREALSEVDAAAIAQDGPRLAAAVARFIEAHERAFTVYAERPPVTDPVLQPLLLEAV